MESAQLPLTVAAAFLYLTALFIYVRTDFQKLVAEDLSPRGCERGPGQVREATKGECWKSGFAGGIPTCRTDHQVKGESF